MNDLTVIRGDSATLTMTLVDPAGDPYDLTDSFLWFTVRDLIAKTTDDGIVIDMDPTTGVAVVMIAAAETSPAPNYRVAYPYDVQILTADGETQTPIRGLFIVIPDVSPAS